LCSHDPIYLKPQGIGSVTPLLILWGGSVEGTGRS
jgi:hypothetical protein